MDWSWLSAKLATAVTLPHFPRFRENMVNEHKVNRRQELHHQIFDAARCMNHEFEISVAL
jgi:hypothetical protein